MWLPLAIVVFLADVKLQIRRPHLRLAILFAVELWDVVVKILVIHFFAISILL